ncbi:VCBS repeat-containing protein [Flavobacteriaceae bacterium KMM 6897]|nr:VCBS repeat-containing protein [Flavobacteriaceae bacterium KMM 6897]
MTKLKFRFHNSIILITIFFQFSCSSPKEKREVVLFNSYCTSCHIAPSIQDLPKEIWATNILPEMGARMGVRDSTYNPFKGFTFSEINIINQTGVYPLDPIISAADWKLLQEYIISMAPVSLEKDNSKNTYNELVQFTPKPISFDSINGSFITLLKLDHDHKLICGNISGELWEFDFSNQKISPIGQFGKAIVDYTELDGITYVTSIGDLHPSEFSSGQIFTIENNITARIPEVLHRPVHTLVHDLDENGTNEIIVSEFGNLTGKLSLFKKVDSVNFKKEILLNQPGTIRVIAKDMNNDGKEDLIALTSQGNESITILYQQENLKFSAQQVLRFSPVYGSSWFDLIDYNGDGFDDIITVNGDNADKSYVQKGYHGMRVHLNDGSNNFEEKYFYPLHGATRVVSNDFDQDGDIDFGLISTFPDYENEPESSFVYLENKNPDTFSFSAYTFDASKLGRWFLMNSEDIDDDGDIDIILSSFTYAFTPVPELLYELWNESNLDLMILENKLITKDKL